MVEKNLLFMIQDAVLYFSPGPILAEDGDKNILTPLIYSILSGEFTVHVRTV